MPSPHSNVSTPAVISGLDQHPPDAIVPQTPPTPPSDQTEVTRYDPGTAMPPSAAIAGVPVCDNTAVGMAYGQEDSMYLTPAATPDATMADVKDAPYQPDIPSPQETLSPKPSPAQLDRRRSSTVISSDEHPFDSLVEESPNSVASSSHDEEEALEKHQYGKITNTSMSGISQPPHRTTRKRPFPESSREVAPSLTPIDLTFVRPSEVRPWDFSNRRPLARYPSSLFQAYSSFTGTQQSDKHRYDVEVTILTVDMEQGSLSGYLLIHGLTQEHAKLQTFFTGEIIGANGTANGSKHNFRTADPSWGANDKVDLLHWARFPPFRHLSSHAKRDLAFEWPLDGRPWWEEQTVFMRWKEHFLVPDHRTRHIQGASFEGFYYICMDISSGDIDGIYFHAKSERYQQLKLTHETKHGVGAPMVQPVMEFR